MIIAEIINVENMEFGAFTHINDRIQEVIDNIIDKEVNQLIAEFEGKVCCLACAFKARQNLIIKYEHHK